MKPHIFAIDPGTTDSAFVLWNPNTKHIEAHGHAPNDEVLQQLRRWLSEHLHTGVAIEMIASYGMPVGAEVFSTCVWIGRFAQSVHDCGISARLVFRKDVKMHLCQTARAKDGNIRQALIDRLGAQGTKKQPGALYGIKKHTWAALAVAIYAQDVAAEKKR